MNKTWRIPLVAGLFTLALTIATSFRCAKVARAQSLDAVSRELQVSAHELEAWRRTFLESGAEGLKRRHGDLEARVLKQAQAKVGELAMRLELAEMLLEKRGYAEELARLKQSRGF